MNDLKSAASKTASAAWEKRCKKTCIRAENPMLEHDSYRLAIEVDMQAWVVRLNRDLGKASGCKVELTIAEAANEWAGAKRGWLWYKVCIVQPLVPLTIESETHCMHAMAAAQRLTDLLYLHGLHGGTAFLSNVRPDGNGVSLDLAARPAPCVRAA